MNDMVQTRGGMEMAPGMKADGAVALAFQSREMIECLGMMQMAKMAPRDEQTVRERLKKAAQNESLAVAAEYIYAKGGTEVTGLSIRAAEALARSFGNVDFGMKEVETNAKETICQAWCWDMETNTRECEYFTVPHSRTKGVWEGNRRVGTEVVPITDQRELDEITRSRGSRIKRACILGVIPVDIQEEFAAACDKTLAQKIAKLVEKKGETGGLKDVIEQMLVKLEDTYKVTRLMVADRFQKKHGGNKDVATAAIYNLDNRQIVMLFRILAGLKDGIATPADYFKGASTERVDAVSADAQKSTAKKTAKDALKARLGVGGADTQATATDASQAAESATDAKRDGELTADDVI